MSKHIQKSAFHSLPSGAVIHPCRLIQRDGTLMWKHALLYANEMIMLEFCLGFSAADVYILTGLFE